MDEDKILSFERNKELSLFGLCPPERPKPPMPSEIPSCGDERGGRGVVALATEAEFSPSCCLSSSSSSVSTLVGASRASTSKQNENN